jgi:hypothetical protein
MKRRLGVAAVLLVAALCLSASGEPANAAPDIYDFAVFLGQDEIGRQRFEVSADGERTQINIEAEFTVRFLYVPVYRYRHTNKESWEGPCLREIRAETNDNGESFFVNGLYRDGRMLVQTHSGRWSGEGCIKTFAYWNRDWIDGGRLLNSQTGELQAADLRTVGEETITVRGAPTKTTRKRIITDKFTIDLWYALNGRWVALQSTTAKGDVLRYALH